MRTWAQAMLIASCCLPVSAQAQQPVLLRGVGLDSCGKFLATVERTVSGKGLKYTHPNGTEFFDAGEVYAEWIQGYLSALNELNARTKKRQVSVDYPGVERWLRNWCQTHPAESVFAAIGAFASEQGAR